MERGSRQSSLQVPTGVSVSVKVLGLSEGFHVYVSLFRDTRMCNQPGVDSFSNSGTCHTRRHTQTHAHALRGGGGAATGPSAETALGGWLAATVRGGPFWWSALPPDTNTLNTPGGTGPGQPPPPRAECSERRGEACSAVTGSQVVGCRVTWGHAHTRPQPHSSTHRFMPSHVTRHWLTHSQIPASHRYTS